MGLVGQPEGLVGRPGGWDDGVKSLQESCAVSLSFLALDSPALVPVHVLTGLQHVVSMPARDGDEWDSSRVVSNLLDEARHFLLDFLEPSCAVWRLGGVHLVDSHDKLLDTQGVSQQGMFSSLTILGNASLELTGAGSDNQDSTISLGCSSDHVLDEISVSRGVDDGNIVLGGLKLPEGNVDGNTSLAFSLQFVQHPSILEGSLS